MQVFVSLIVANVHNNERVMEQGTRHHELLTLIIINAITHSRNKPQPPNWALFKQPISRQLCITHARLQTSPCQYLAISVLNIWLIKGINM